MKTLLLSILILTTQASFAQLAITTQTPANATTVVQNNFIIPNTGWTTNIVLNQGFPGRFATFTGGSGTSLNMNSGVILATGNTSNIANPSFNQIEDGNDCGPSSVSSTVCTDLQLSSLIPGFNIFDITTLEFDFAPLTDTIRFQYVFASEEYPEYVCGSFNDVFGFFVSGPDPSSGSYNSRNFAVIPGTNIPASINSINPGVAGGSSGGGTCSGPGQSLAYSSLYLNNNGSVDIIFDGLTTVLDISIPVVVLANYHFKLGLCNASDGIFESGVFLRDNTFGGDPPILRLDSTAASTGARWGDDHDSVYVCNNGSVTLVSPAAIDYNWSTGDSTQSITLAQPAVSQTISCMLTSPGIPLIGIMGPVHVVADSTCNVTVVGLNEIKNENVSVSVINGEIKILSDKTIPENTQVKIFNLSGSLVNKFKTQTENKAMTFPLNNLNNGIYILNLYNRNFNVTKRFEKF